MARVRVRQHVNPLCSKFQVSLIPPEWTKIYTNLTLPLHLDIGCARGRFLWQMAQLEPKNKWRRYFLKKQFLKI